MWYFIGVVAFIALLLLWANCQITFYNAGMLKNAEYYKDRLYDKGWERF